jgi:hypothetical protein
MELVLSFCETRLKRRQGLFLRIVLRYCTGFFWKNNLYFLFDKKKVPKKSLLAAGAGAG